MEDSESELRPVEGRMMNQYHIYEAIGQGKSSTVYKGRNKKTIEYFACKSVDKSRKSKVLQEVRILHSLNHPNVLKFYAWYETSAHMWLVLEYCVGGDLRTLLLQNCKLPEDSVYGIAYDLVTALMFLHSKGIIYCHLKPSNILLDEKGHIKLCDFRLARNLDDISKSPTTGKRGTPCYMAPELYEDGGVHSFASDLWALGCVLYECYTGRPPFVATEFTELVESIRSDPTPPLPGNATPSFVSLIESLLVKDPAQRIQWADLCGHAFWKKSKILVQLPPQPAFDNLVTKLTPGGSKAQTKLPGKATVEKHGGRPGANREVYILRLSRIAKANLQKENEKDNYGRPLPNRNENCAELKIDNTDMELDFDEDNDDEGPDELEGNENTSCAQEDELSKNESRKRKRVTSDNVPDENSSANETPTSDEARDCHDEEQSEPMEVSAALPCASQPQLKTIWHLSDLSVGPVIPSRESDKEAVPSLSFAEAPQPSDFGKMGKQELEALHNRTVTVLSGTSADMSEKQDLIRHLETLSSNADAANFLTNGPIMLVLVKVLRESKTPAELRVQIASLIGLLIEHSTSIEDELANSGILDSLTDGLRDEHEKVRRFSMAALGELLSYISTLNEHKDVKSTESPSKETRSASAWEVSDTLISLVSSFLRKGEDDLTQLYALRTIENICSQGAYWASRFYSQDLISDLCYIHRAAGKQESTRQTAGSCLVRLARFHPPCFQTVLEKYSLKEIASSFVKGSAQEQQICLNLLNMAMIESDTFSSFVTLTEEKNLCPSLLSIIEQGTEVLMGKAVLFVALLCKDSRRWLTNFLCNTRFLPVVDRIAKEKESYVQQCLESFVDVIASIIPGLLDTVTSDIQQLTGRNHGPVSTLNSRTALKTNAKLFPVVLHLLGSSSFKNKMITQQILHQLANITKLVEASSQGIDDFRTTLLQVLECIAEDAPLVTQNAEIIIREIIPSLAAIFNGNKDEDARFLCLKIWFDSMTILLTECTEIEQQTSEVLKSLSNSHFLSLFPALIPDEDPIPAYALKLLVMLLEFGYIRISEFHQNTVSQCFESFLGDLSSANVNNVKLYLALASAPEMETKRLSQLVVVRRIGNLLEFVNGKDMKDFLEPTLNLCRAFLLRSLGNKKGLSSNYTKEPMLLSETLPTFEVDPQECITDIADFASNIGLFLHLAALDDTSIADIASECVVLLLKAASREATMRLLTNPPDIRLLTVFTEKLKAKLESVLVAEQTCSKLKNEFLSAVESFSELQSEFEKLQRGEIDGFDDQVYTLKTSMTKKYAFYTEWGLMELTLEALITKMSKLHKSSSQLMVLFDKEYSDSSLIKSCVNKFEEFMETHTNMLGKENLNAGMEWSNERYVEDSQFLWHKESLKELQTSINSEMETFRSFKYVAAAKKEQYNAKVFSIFSIRRQLFPLLRKCIYGSVEENIANIPLESWDSFYEVLKFVSSYQLMHILTAQPTSDITIFECLKPLTSTTFEPVRFAYWKLHEDVQILVLEDEWSEIMGSPKDQLDHDLCWAFVIAELVSAVRLIKKYDIEKVEYSCQDLADFTNPELRSEMKINEKGVEHFCYPYDVDKGLDYVSKHGIEREADRPFQVECNRDVVAERNELNLGYIGEVVSLNTIEEVLESLKEHPIAASIPIFEPEYSAIGDGIYRGPTSPISVYKTMHAINLIGAGVDKNGEKYLTGRTSHGQDFGKNGTFKISFELMMICLTHDKHGMFLEHPFSLVSGFVYPRLLSLEDEERKKEETKRRKEAGSKEA